MKNKRNKTWLVIGDCIYAIMCVLLVLVLFGEQSLYVRIGLLLAAVLYMACRFANYMVSRKENANLLENTRADDAKLCPNKSEEEELLATVMPSDVDESIMAQAKAMEEYKEVALRYSGIANVLKDNPANAQALNITPEYIEKCAEELQLKKEAFEAATEKTEKLKQALQRKKEMCSMLDKYLQ